MGKSKKRRKVVIITDGDNIARQAAETAAAQVGGRCISRSVGKSGDEIIDMIKQSPFDPVVVMVDDRGKPGLGEGEAVIKSLAESKDIEIMGVIAVASNTQDVEGVKVDCSVDSSLNIISGPVDKLGNPSGDSVVYGDTLDILNSINVPIIVGVGDPGKMDGRDDCILGAPVLTKALRVIMGQK
ncbi:MAG TPA: stage V sporulation protein AE [Clostridia bacterium]|nr:stage V sporulation protein AE [Clostridia bacterium]